MKYSNMNKRDKEIFQSNIISNIIYYNRMIIKLKREINTMKKNGIVANNEYDLNKKWTNKLKSINQKEKGIKRISKIIKRICDYSYLSENEKMHNNLCLKDLYCYENENKTFEEIIENEIKERYIDDNMSPLKCNCGCKSFYQCNEYYEDEILVEYSLRCKNCHNIVGHWSYGYWEI